MKKTITICLCLSVTLLFLFLILAKPLVAGDKAKLSGMRFVQLARGGLLYDDWPVELGVKIDKANPSYPAEGQKKGSSTWRCKECHGWDYKGKAGAYKTGSHYTGITGIRSFANVDPLEVIKILKNDDHAFGDMLSENDYDALAIFVSYGQLDTDLFIDRKTKKSIGDPANGGRIYLATCIKCHGIEGKEISFKDEKEPEYIGTIAKKNPWVTLHKIRWGHPGTPMIALHFLELKEQLDVLAFTQSLPEK
jgi:thiosulfate dehydrogenase